MVDDTAVGKAVKAAIAAELSSMIRTTKVLEADEHQGIDVQHVQFGLTRKYNPTTRAGRTSRPSYRMSTAAVAQTASDVTQLEKRVRAGIEGRAIPVGPDHLTTPITFETSDEVDQAEGSVLFTARTTWTFTLTRRSGS